MSFLTRVANGLGTLLGVLAETTVTLIQEVKRGYQEFQRRSGRTTAEVKSEAQRDRERLREVNEKIMHYRNLERSGMLSERDRERWYDMVDERKELLLTAVDSRTNPASTAGTAQHDLDLVSG